MLEGGGELTEKELLPATELESVLRGDARERPGPDFTKGGVVGGVGRPAGGALHTDELLRLSASDQLHKRGAEERQSAAQLQRAQREIGTTRVGDAGRPNVNSCEQFGSKCLMVRYRGCLNHLVLEDVPSCG